MKCPHCGVQAADGSAECPGCGIIFAKLKTQKERIVLEAKIGLSASDEGTPVRINIWKVRAIAAGIVALWMIGFGLYYRHSVAVLREKQAQSPVMIRDPQTGDMREIPVVNAPVNPKKAD